MSFLAHGNGIASAAKQSGRDCDGLSNTTRLLRRFAPRNDKVKSFNFEVRLGILFVP
jgi:hypothetical protein